MSTEPRVLMAFLIPLILIFDRRKSFRVVAGLTMALLLVEYASPALKEFFHRPRPHLFWENVRVIFKKPTNDAFPSGHTAIGFAAAVILNYCYPQLRWFYGVAVWIAVTRIYVGVHYPSDLIGGVVLGVICGWAAIVILKYCEQTEENPK